MSRYLTVAMVIAMLLTQPVSAAVLTANNKARLCTAPLYDGQEAVDRDVLAALIAFDAGAGIYLDGSNPTGLRDEVIQLQSKNGIKSEPVYVLLNYGSKSVPEENKPFGPQVDLAKDKRALEVRNKIAERVIELHSLIKNGSVVNGEIKYIIKRRTMALGAPKKDDPNWVHTNLLFQDDPMLVIICARNDSSNVSATPNPATPNPGQVSSSVSVLDHLRLRGTSDALNVKANDLNSADRAAITYQHDGIADTETFGIKGVLGVHFDYLDGVVDVIPYISYENRSITGGKGNINKIAPGLLFGYKIEQPAFAIHTKLETFFLKDIHYDSSQVTLRVYSEPAFALGKGQGVLFGSYIMPFYPLQWRPDLKLIGNISHVFDKGTNPALSEANNYFGLGGELSLSTRLDLGQPISDFDLQGGVRYLRLLGDINKQEARRWFCSLNYKPTNIPYIGIALTFSKGENNDTFQDEDRYSIDFNFSY